MLEKDNAFLSFVFKKVTQRRVESACAESQGRIGKPIKLNCKNFSLVTIFTFSVISAGFEQANTRGQLGSNCDVC